MTAKTFLYRHDELCISRPYGIDVDEQDWLWEGTSGDRLMGHNLRTAELRIIDVPEMDGHVVYSTFCWHGKLVLEMGHCPFYLVYDLATGRCERKTMPGTNPIAWYGTRLPGDKLMFCERGEGLAIILDAPEAAPRVIKCPFEGNFGTAEVASDGLAYSMFADPARVVRFDPQTERFIDEKLIPWPQVGISGKTEHNGVMFCADSAGGRILPFDLATQKWQDPIVHPDHGKVFGFIGGAFDFGGKGYYCLSTYTARSTLDRKTGGVIIPKGVPITVDGKPMPRFMERMLVLDQATRTFEYLIAPPQPDGVPLLCYSWTDGKRFAVTGIVIPFAEPGVADREPGNWLVLQSQPATEEPPLGPYRFNWSRTEHLAKYRRTYPSRHSLFIPAEPHSPAIVNMSGPAVQYPPGRDQELTRRAAKTDPAKYWKDVVTRMGRSDVDQATRVRLILWHVNNAVYYNPIRETQSQNAIAAHECHDARCGLSSQITMNLCKAAGVEARTTSLFHHVVAEAFYDGSWHIADALFFSGRQPARDGRVLSVEELKADPYFADGCAQPCFVYDNELITSEDGYLVLGYVLSPWGTQPYYSYYLGSPMEVPPTVPVMLPASRIGDKAVRLNWSPSVRRYGGKIEYDVRVFKDRACKEEIFRATTDQISAPFDVPEGNRMYFVEVRAMDDHRQKNPNTWYPAARSNFVLVPDSQYGWYGVL